MKKVLIIGAGFLQSFVIKKAKDMGYETLAVDVDSNAIGFGFADKHEVIDIVDEKACLAYAQKENIDGVLTAATDHGVLTASYVAQQLGLNALNYEVAKLIKNKYRVRKCLYENHVDDAEQAFEVDAETNIEELSRHLSFPVIVKPCDGSGSRGASRVNKISDLESACEYAMKSSITQKAEIETFIEGTEYGVETLVVDGEPHVFAVMRKWMTDPPFYAELGHAIPNDLTSEIEGKTISCVKAAIKALGVNTGPVNMDLIITKDGRVYIIDIGARMGGNMIGPCVIPYGTGIDYMADMLRNAVGDEVELEEKPHGAVATRLLAFCDGTIKHLPDIKAIEKQFDVEIYHHMTKGMHVNEYHTNLDGCGYIVAKGANVDQCLDKAEKALHFLKKSLF